MKKQMIIALGTAVIVSSICLTGCNRDGNDNVIEENDKAQETVKNEVDDSEEQEDKKEHSLDEDSIISSEDEIPKYTDEELLEVALGVNDEFLDSANKLYKVVMCEDTEDSRYLEVVDKSNTHYVLGEYGWEEAKDSDNGDEAVDLNEQQEFISEQELISCNNGMVKYSNNGVEYRIGSNESFSNKLNLSISATSSDHKKIGLYYAASGGVLTKPAVNLDIDTLNSGTYIYDYLYAKAGINEGGNQVYWQEFANAVKSGYTIKVLSYDLENKLLIDVIKIKLATNTAGVMQISGVEFVKGNETKDMGSEQVKNAMDRFKEIRKDAKIPEKVENVIIDKLSGSKEDITYAPLRYEKKTGSYPENAEYPLYAISLNESVEGYTMLTIYAKPGGEYFGYSISDVSNFSLAQSRPDEEGYEAPVSEENTTGRDIFIAGK